MVALLTGSAALSGVALGHAAYKSSEPGDRATVDSAPSRVTAEFTEPLADGSYLQVTDPCGAGVDAGDVNIVGYEMSVSMSGDKAGRYSVFYKAFSRLDPHVVEGTFSFTATSGASCPSAEEELVASEGGKEAAPRSAGGGGQAPSSGGGVEVAQASSNDRAGEGGARSASRSGTGGSSQPPGREPTSATVPNLAAPEETETPRPTGALEGIPLGPFVVSLLLAALIGAAGGKIYAGIMGPRA